MDYINDSEIQLLIQNIKYSDKKELERTRLLMYCISTPYMKFKKNIKDFFPLETDKEEDKTEILEGEKLEQTREIIKKAFNIKN